MGYFTGLIFTLEPFPSSNQFDDQLLSFLEKASWRLCEWFSETQANGPLPSSYELPEVGPGINGCLPEDLLNDLEQLMNGAYRPLHPGALAHLDPPPLSSSIVGELICAGLNNNLLAEELSPSLTSLERKLCQWISQRVGMLPGSGGVAASGGTLSNLMAIVIARHQADLQSDSSSIILASADAHVSFQKAVRVMGLKEDSFRQIDIDDEGRMSIDSLNKTLLELREEKRKCFAIVATAGTTIRGSIDPLVEIAEIASSEGIWLHVDASIGGVFALSHRTSNLVKGIQMADSIALNPQKLLGITKTSSLLLLSDYKKLSTPFETGLPYVEPSSEYDLHGGEIGLQGTRSAEVLKLWLGLRHLGENGISNLLEKSLLRRKYLMQRLDSSKFKIISGPLHLFAFTPLSSSIEDSRLWSIKTRNKLLESKFMLSRPSYNNRSYLKVVLGNPYTENSDLDKLAELINQSIVNS